MEPWQVSQNLNKIIDSSSPSGIMKINVECYSGYRGEETPRRFEMGNIRVEVIEILDRSLSPGYRHFKILGSDHTVYLLRCDENSWEWSLEDRKQ